MKKISLFTVAIMMAMGLCSSANADKLGFNLQVTGASNYILRGLTLTSNKAAIFTEATVTYGNFYAGMWGSNVDLEYSFSDTKANIEIDYYAGYANAYKNLEYSITYAKYTYPGDHSFSTDELKLDVGYNIDKLKIGVKEEMGTWRADKLKKINYSEVYSSYNFGIATLNASAGTYQTVGDNYSIGVSKAGKFEGKNVEFKLDYVTFSADKASGLKDQDHLYGQVIFSF